MYRFLRREKFRIFAILSACMLTFVGAWLLLHRPLPVEAQPVRPRVASAVDKVLSARQEEVLEVDEVPFGEQDDINVLILGIDSRKEGQEQHCDAIHMVSINTEDWTVEMTSVPRGTYAYIPPGGYAENEYYLANACAFAGLDYGVEQIERIVGVKADYVVTVGFSQTLGVLRALDLPTTESLQWLRHRRSYAIGDVQRSQNQAVFMKDVALRILDGNGLPEPLFYLLYTFIDTEMDYATAKTLYDALREAQIVDRPDDIVLTMKPEYDVEEYHLDLNHPSDQVNALLDKIRRRTSKDDLSDQSLSDVQEELIDYLEVYLDSSESLESMFDEQLWRQVEEEGKREQLHYKFVESYAQELLPAEHEIAVQLVADYILEKQTTDQLIWEQMGRALLESIVQ